MTLNTGTGGVELITKQNTRMTVNLGDSTHPGNFVMNPGTMWDIDINGHGRQR